MEKRNNLYEVKIRDFDCKLEFNFKIGCKDKNDAEIIAIENLVDNETYTNMVLGCSTYEINKIEDNIDDSKLGVINFEVFELKRGKLNG